MIARTKPSVTTIARLTGALYLATLPFGVFGLMYVTSTPLVGAGAARSVEEAGRLLRFGVASAVIGQLLFVVVVLGLFELLAPVSRRLAVVMAVLALLSVPIALLTEVSRLAAARVLTGTDLGAFTPAQLQAQAKLFLDLYQEGILIAESFWGLWLFPLALLVFRSGFLPKLLGIIIAVAAVSYLAECSTELLAPGRTFPLGFLRSGELLLPLWLVTMGVSAGKWEEMMLRRTHAEEAVPRTVA